MSNQNREYGKKLTLTLTDGTTKVVTAYGFKAQKITEVLKKLDNNARYVTFPGDNDGDVEYYDIGSASCGFCLVAKVESLARDAENTPCEDALPNCDEDESKSES